MSQYQGPTAFYELGNLLVDAIELVLSDSLGGAVQRACVVPGEIAWDNCDCGLLAISVRRWSLSETFPEDQSQGGSRSTPCDMPWLVGDLTIQVVRCAPSPQGVGMISVPCAELDTSAQVLISDAYVTMNETVRLLCELKDSDQIIDYVLGNESTVGPNGGCVGVELEASIGIYR